MLTPVGQFLVTNPKIRLINTWWFLSDDDGISRIYQVSKGIGAREVCMTNLGILQDKNWALLPQDLQDRNPCRNRIPRKHGSIWFNKDEEDPSAKSRSYSCSLMSPAMRAMAFTRLGGTGTPPFASPHPRLRSRGNHKRDCWRRIEGWSIPEWSLCPLCQLCHPPEKWWKIYKFFVEPSFLATIILRTSMTSQWNGSIFHFRLNTKIMHHFARWFTHNNYPDLSIYIIIWQFLKLIKETVPGQSNLSRGLNKSAKSACSRRDVLSPGAVCDRATRGLCVSINGGIPK